MKNRMLWLALPLLLCSWYAQGQNLKPFPQEVKYSCGFKPQTVCSVDARQAYNHWKKICLTRCNDGYRTICEKEETKVESIGFAMILTAYFGDKDLFDGLYHFYKSKCTEEANGMMAWIVNDSAIIDPGSATDGDIDVAFALIVASNQWGKEYMKNAKEVIKTIKNSVVLSSGDMKILAPGYSKRAWGGAELTDMEYYTPAFFRLFAVATHDNDWNRLADDSYKILNAGADATTGLIPDWLSVNGTPGGNSKDRDRAVYFGYDACRVPWRIALDYLWNGNEQSQSWCKKISNWACHIGVKSIKDGYNLNGTDHNNGIHNSAFVGGLAVSAMCNNQIISDLFGEEMSNGQLKDNHWFSMSTRALYMLTISGNFWKPVIK